MSTINALMLGMLSAVARKDYDDRRSRQARGIEKARKENYYKGRGDNVKLQAQIEDLLRDGKSYNNIIDLLNCSRTTISKVGKRVKDGAQKTGCPLLLVKSSNT